MALHGGEVSAHSDGEDRGAEIVVRLPLHRADDRTESVPATAAPHEPLRVLVIEDNDDAAEALTAVLELDGHAVELARDGVTGLRLARERTPDVVLCDLGLPGMSGYDVARALRGEPALRSTLLVALSGYATHEDVERTLGAGFDRHLAKPATLEELRVVLAERPRRG